MPFISSFPLKSAVQSALAHVVEVLDFAILHPARISRKRAILDAADYVATSMREAVGVYTSREVLNIALSRTEIEGHFMEFGVYRGGTLRHIAKHARKATTVSGFDSFQGLPESWNSGLDKGAFDLQGKLPSVPEPVRLYPGWFNETLPLWVKENKGPVAFLHIDCDLYSSTKVIFDSLVDQIVPGTVIVFDEYFGLPNWREHEFRAFGELVAEARLAYSYICYAKYQVAVLITGKGV